MKRRSERMQKIVSLAAADERRESLAMGESQRQLGALIERLDELTAYRREYAARELPASGVSALRWRDYQTFLARLDQAVTAQRELILDREKNVDAHRRRWMNKRRRLESLTRVLDRYRSEERVAADRRRQKVLDDRPPPGDRFDAD